MAEPLLVLVILTILPGANGRFLDFERRAVGIMARYGGVVERIIIAEPSAIGEPRQVHLLRFPSAQAFASYQCDAELVSLGEMRSTAIAHTQVLLGREGPIG